MRPAAARRPQPGDAGETAEDRARLLGRFVAADRHAFALRAARDALAEPLARIARSFVAARAWCPFGFARLSDYSRETLGRSSRWLRDLCALDRSLEAMPPLREALAGRDGGRPLGRVRALLVGRVAAEASVAAWIERARGRTVRQLAEEAREARARGSVWPPGNKDGAAAGEPGARAVGQGDQDPEAEGRGVLVRLLVPEPVRVAFDETLELHRALEGSEATVTSFVEALVAEAIAGAATPFDADRAPLAATKSLEAVEGALARTTRCWAHLDWSPPETEGVAAAAAILARARALEAKAGRGGPAELAEQLREAVALEDDIERALGRLLAEMGEMEAWVRLRFSGVGHYGEERLGMGRRTAETRAALARALERHPRIREAYEEGRIGIEATCLLLRALGRGESAAGIEEEWVARAEEVTIKRLRDEIRAVGLRRVVASRREVPPPDDGDWYASIERRAGATRERVRALGRMAAAGTSADVFLRLRLPDEVAGDLLASIEAARVELAARVEAVPWWEPWPGEAEAAGSVLAARGYSNRCRRAPAWVGLLALLEQYLEAWDDPRGQPAREGDPVYVRAGWRCEAPACTSQRNLEQHHIVYRSLGGSDEPSNLLCLCRFHHSLGEHGDLAQCRGAAPLGVLWRLGKVEVCRWYRNERRLGQEPVPGRATAIQ